MKILVFPKDVNPYQDFLYGGFPKQVQSQLMYISYKISKYEFINLVFLILITISKRIKGFEIYHLHFLYNFNSPSKNKIIKRLSLYFYFLFIIFYIQLIKLLGYKFVWTMHSIKTHENQTINDLYITKYIISKSDVTIVHSKTSINDLKKLNANLEKVKIIPIGNYNDYYKNTISIDMARKKLKLEKTDFVFLYFGIIKKYKGIDELITAFKSLEKNFESIKLLVVGNCYESDLKESILEQSLTSKNIKTIIQFIDNDDIQNYFKSANVIVTPYKKITTSSTTFLSFSFHKPIIFPRIGNLRELPKNIGIEYKANNVKDLERAMESAINEREKIVELGENAYKYSRKFNWKDISTTTYKLFQSLE